MNTTEVLLFLLGIIVLVWVIISINNFVSGTPLLRYAFSPMAFGLFVIIFGLFFGYYIKENHLE